MVEHCRLSRAQDTDKFNQPDNLGYGIDYNDFSFNEGLDDTEVNNTEILWDQFLFRSEDGEVIEEPDIPVEVQQTGQPLRDEEQADYSSDEGLVDQGAYWRPHPTTGRLTGTPLPVV